MKRLFRPLVLEKQVIVEGFVVRFPFRARVRVPQSWFP